MSDVNANASSRPVPPHAEPVALQLVVLAILLNAAAFEWSVQGFGVLRLYIRSLGRLHIWDERLRFPNVSLIHNHSWNLRSTVVSGELRNTRYEPRGEIYAGHRYHGKRLITGYNTSDVVRLPDVSLLPQPVEVYRAGSVYEQRRDEIHQTDADDGTISIMRRDEDVEGQADVYWRATSEWGTAKPRPATPDEVQLAVVNARRVLEKEIR